MSGTLTLKGTIETNGSGCAVTTCGTSASGKSLLSIGAQCGSCSADVYEQVVPPTTFAVATAGSAGQNFIDLEATAGLDAIEFLYLESSAAIVARLGAAAATLTGSGGTFPTGFSGAETLVVAFDGTSVTTTFDGADETAAQCVARINAACALAGLATPRASVATSGQITLTGILTGAQGSLDVVSGSGAATLGLTGLEAVGAGEDVGVSGIFLLESDRSTAPARVQLSGQATVTVVAAGQSAS